MSTAPDDLPSSSAVPERLRSTSTPVPGRSAVPERFRSLSAPLPAGQSAVPERFRSLSAPVLPPATALGDALLDRAVLAHLERLASGEIAACRPPNPDYERPVSVARSLGRPLPDVADSLIRLERAGLAVAVAAPGPGWPGNQVGYRLRRPDE